MAARIAEQWFDLEPVDGAITLLREPFVHPVWQSNIWHVRGRDRDLLVDAGMGVGDLAAAIAGIARRPLIAVATHRHADHVGNLHQFEIRYAHHLDAAEIANPTSFASLITADYPEPFVKHMADSGQPMGEVLLSAYPDPDFDPYAYKVQPAPVSRLIDEGDQIDLGDRVFEVLHLPGHTPGSIGLYDAEAGVLFSGDAIYDGPLYDFLPESDIGAYLDTMYKLIELPVEVVHGGHDGSFGRDRMREIAHGYISTRAAKAV